MPLLRSLACQCGDPSCRERVYVEAREYKTALALGRIVAFGHAPDAFVFDARLGAGYAVVALEEKKVPA